jgi:glycosyltransferase involved in cell wall biosynthesis
MFTNTYLPHVGGVARSVEFISNDLRKLGHEVLIITPTFQDEIEDENEKEVLRVPAIQNFNGSDFSVRITIPFLISNKIKEFQPDIIHSHHPYLLGDAALRTALRENIPLVFTHHTLYEQYTHYVPLDSEVMKRFVINLSTHYANNCRNVIAPSQSIAELLKLRGVVSPIVEIPTGVDIDFFESGMGADFRNSYGIGSNETVIGHVSRLAPEKNQEYLAEAVALYLVNNPGKFVVVGEGSSEERIRDIFSDYNLHERLILAGRKSGQELSNAYKAMDLFVFASKSETQGMVLVEAMAASLPVIALDASGTREVVEDNKNGRLLEEGAPTESFAKAIGDFFSSIGTANVWRKGAAKTAGGFSRDKIAKRVQDLYQGLISDLHQHVEDLDNELVMWNKILRSLQAEWILITDKAAASINSLNKEN